LRNEGDSLKAFRSAVTNNKGKGLSFMIGIKNKNWFVDTLDLDKENYPTLLAVNFVPK